MMDAQTAIYRSLILLAPFIWCVGFVAHGVNVEIVIRSLCLNNYFSSFPLSVGGCLIWCVKVENLKFNV